MKPASNVAAGRPPTMNHLMVTSTTTQITGPALAAWLLAMHMALRQPGVLALAVNRFIDRAHRCAGIVNETVARVQAAIGRHPQIAGPRPTWIRPMRPGMQ